MNRATRRTIAAGMLAFLVTAGMVGCGGSRTDTTTTASPAAEVTTATIGDAIATTTASDARVMAPEMPKVELIMDWVPWVLDIPVDVAQEKGFYKDAGLEVTQTLPAGPTDVVKFVSTGKSQFGLYYAPDTLMGVAEGASLVSVGSLMSHAPVGLAIAPGVTAAEPKDLVGKVVAVSMIPSTRASFDSMLKAGGVDPSSVTLVDPGFDLVAPLLTGTYQAVAFTEFAELVEAKTAKPDVAYLDFRDWGTPDFAFLNLITSSDFAGKNPGTVRAFTQATLAGLTYAAEHPEEAVDIYISRHPELKKELLLAQWNAAVPSMAVATADHPAGWQDPDAWKALSAWMLDTKLLRSPIDATAAVNNDFLATP